MPGQGTLRDFLTIGHPVAAARPWPRVELDAKCWRLLIERLGGADWILLAEWATGDSVHVALRDEANGEISIASRACPDGRFVALGQMRPGAIRLERAIHDLWGLVPEGLDDQRPWLDHGRWPRRRPLAAQPDLAADAPYRYDFLAAEGDGLHQIPVGPVHAGIIEPGHFRFHAQGETVVRLEERLGYVHKGIAAALMGKPVAQAAKIIARVSGDSTVAYSLAFARAVEAALDVTPPPRAQWIRALLAELERIANHVFDIGAICNDAAFVLMLSHMGVLRERVLRVNEGLFGHRLLMDRIVPGGVAVDLREGAADAIRKLLHGFAKDFRKAVHLYNETPSLIDRTTGTGFVAATLAHRFGAGGFVGRASRSGHDARKTPGYPPYDDLDFAIPVLAEGDVHARIEVRIAEVQASLGLIEQILTKLPSGSVLAPLPARTGEGVAVAESFRGEVLVWVRLDERGHVAQCHPHDPSWFQWPLLEAAIEGNIVADFPVCNKSFNCSYSGHDL